VLGLLIFIGRYLSEGEKKKIQSLLTETGESKGAWPVFLHWKKSSLEEVVWKFLNSVFTGKDRGVQECLARLSSLEEIVSQEKNPNVLGEKN